ncbi:DUF2939 domain-containing protein [Brevundimonas diminuta]|uniref:DUF2939 domain-containing protein n=1 Tax=Brevundimonas diminuta TaxID=293 RepID=UPI00209764EF|nr:DUF2939 domain-containing protein [Brevundimonas diminuta]MCO8019594.1 DUF2939 domain-containing protein [Brevundimonas diminuta]MCO8022676.1 DUF2939 domain-containing protein [Brevundimonas diminuta]
MNRKLIIRLGLAAAAVFVVAYGASPLLAARSLVQAAKAGDAQGLERQVDFPAFRASLKDELNARMMVEMRKDKRLGDSGLSGLGMLLAPALVGGAVDAFVTPQAIALMVQEGRAPKTEITRREPQEPKSGDKRVRQSWGYRDLDTFAVTLTRDDQPGEQVSLLMKRRNLFGWKLAGIDLGTPE